MSLLTDKQEKFVQGLIKGKSQREAYKLAYNVKTMSDAVIDVKASELLKNGKVSVRHGELRSRIVKESEDECIINAKRVLKEYVKLATSDITDYLEIITERVLVDRDPETNEPISEIKQFILLKNTADISKDKLAAIESVKQGRYGLEFKLHDKKGALDSIGKHLGMFTEKVEVSGKDGEPLQVVFNIPRPPVESKD